MTNATIQRKGEKSKDPSDLKTPINSSTEITIIAIKCHVKTIIMYYFEMLIA